MVVVEFTWSVELQDKFQVVDTALAKVWLMPRLYAGAFVISGEHVSVSGGADNFESFTNQTDCSDNVHERHAYDAVGFQNNGFRLKLMDKRNALVTLCCHPSVDEALAWVQMLLLYSGVKGAQEVCCRVKRTPMSTVQERIYSNKQCLLTMGFGRIGLRFLEIKGQMLAPGHSDNYTL